MQRRGQVFMVVLCFFLLAAAVVSVGQIGDSVVWADHCSVGCSGGPCTANDQCSWQFGNPLGCCICAFPYPGAEYKECICRPGYC
jgi:hypothetical protein